MLVLRQRRRDQPRAADGDRAEQTEQARLGLHYAVESCAEREIQEKTGVSDGARKHRSETSHRQKRHYLNSEVEGKPRKILAPRV